LTCAVRFICALVMAGANASGKREDLNAKGSDKKSAEPARFSSRLIAVVTLFALSFATWRLRVSKVTGIATLTRRPRKNFPHF